MRPDIFSDAVSNGKIPLLEIDPETRFLSIFVGGSALFRTRHF
jgi:hypothetical protein